MLIMAAWPKASELAGYIDEAAERTMALSTGVISAIRSTRSRYGISPKAPLDVLVKLAPEDVEALEAQRTLITNMANVGELSMGDALAKPEESSVVLTAGAEVYVRLSGLVDFDAERARLRKQLDALEKDVAKLQKKLSNPGYLAKAKPEIIAKDQAKFEESQAQLSMVRQQLEELA